MMGREFQKTRQHASSYRIYRVDEGAYARRKEEPVVGLAIAKWAVETHGGTIDVSPDFPTVRV